MARKGRKKPGARTGRTRAAAPTPPRAKRSRARRSRHDASRASNGEARLQSIIDSAMDAIITVDESQRVVMFNKAAEKTFAVAASEAIGAPLDRFIPERFRAAHAAHVRGFARTGETTRAMGRLSTILGLRSDGTEFPIEASISQASAAGRKFLTVILRDVSEKKKLEAQLLQAQKMEGIGRLAAGVAHDFNNLLMAIFNYLALAARKLEPGHPSLAPLAHVHEASERAATLTRQLLAFARKQVVTLRVVSARQVVAGVVPMLRRLIDEDVTLRTALAEDTGNVRADTSQIEQVLMNLVVNARDAMPRGGSLTIETSNLTLDEAYLRMHVGATPGEYVMIAVTDTGEGMTPEVQARLFEPFFTTKPPGQGTGLGLATCHGIVKQVGGHIAIYSESGRGTSVKVFLPRIMEGAAGQSAARTAARPRGGTETVLLVEDSVLIRELAAEALHEAGYSVIVAEGGSQGLAASAAHEGAIDLLVTDVVMPGVSGVHLAESLARSRPKLKVIFMSGYTQETISRHGVESGDAAFLSKPFMTDDLLRVVRAVLDGGR